MSHSLRDKHGRFRKIKKTDKKRSHKIVRPPTALSTVFLAQRINALNARVETLESQLVSVTNRLSAVEQKQLPTLPKAIPYDPTPFTPSVFPWQIGQDKPMMPRPPEVWCGVDKADGDIRTSRNECCSQQAQTTGFVQTESTVETPTFQQHECNERVVNNPPIANQCAAVTNEAILAMPQNKTVDNLMPPTAKEVGNWPRL